MKLVNKFFTILIIASFLLAACGNNTAAFTTAHSNKSRQRNPSVADSDLSQLVDGNNAFAFGLYHALLSEKGNLILSPFSVSLALAMTYAGARGETESQMASTLHFEAGQDIHPAFNALDLKLSEKPSLLSTDENAESMQLNIANAVWAEQTQAFLEPFLDTIALNYGAGVNLADFKSQFEAERKQINSWVSDQTEDKINDLLPDGSLNADTRMVLVNAIYFKADWLNQFDPIGTHTQAFHLLDGSEVDVDMMGQSLSAPYIKGDGYQAIEMKYAGETTAMDIIVPDEGTFEVFEASLTHETFTGIINGMQETYLSFNFPKFKYESSFGLSSTLEGMGMKDAFDRNKADFSGMIGKKDLFISAIIHKAFVAVDEDGTEAAAATAVIMETAGAIMMDTSLIVDRPFIYVIRDLRTGQVLFVGRVLDPTK